MNQYTEDPLLEVYRPKPRRFGRPVGWRDRFLGVVVILALIFGLWWMVFHDSRSYVFTEAQVESVFSPKTVEIASGYTVYSRDSKAPAVIILRSGASDDELSEVIERIELQMASATEKLAKEFPLETIRGVSYEFHNLIIICAFDGNCAWERQFLSEVQRLNLADTADTLDPHFVPSGAEIEQVESVK